MGERNPPDDPAGPEVEADLAARVAAKIADALAESLSPTERALIATRLLADAAVAEAALVNPAAQQILAVVRARLRALAAERVEAWDELARHLGPPRPRP